MRTYDIILDGTNEARLTIDHKFLLILSDQGFTVDLAVLKGSGFAEVKGVQAGFGLRLTDQTRGKEFIFRCANPQTIKVFVGDDEAIYNRLSGTVTVNGGNLNSITQDVKTQNQGQDYNGNYKSMTPIVGNTPEMVLAPGSNTNGVLVVGCGFYGYNSANAPLIALVAKGTPPINVTNGDVIYISDDVKGGGISCGSLKNPIKVPAGLGLYVISNITQTITYNYVLYKTL